jgi:hypothetical protein
VKTDTVKIGPRSPHRPAARRTLPPPSHRQIIVVGSAVGLLTAEGLARRGQLRLSKARRCWPRSLATAATPAEHTVGSSPWPPGDLRRRLARSVSSPRGPWSRLIVAVDRQIWVGPRWGPMFLAMSPS